MTIDYVNEGHAGGAGRVSKALPINEEEEPVKKHQWIKNVNVGAISHDQLGIMPMPKFNTYPAGEVQLCGVALRNGSRRCNNPNCKLDHTKPQ